MSFFIIWHVLYFIYFYYLFFIFFKVLGPKSEKYQPSSTASTFRSVPLHNVWSEKAQQEPKNVWRVQKDKTVWSVWSVRLAGKEKKKIENKFSQVFEITKQNQQRKHTNVLEKNNDWKAIDDDVQFWIMDEAAPARLEATLGSINKWTLLFLLSVCVCAVRSLCPEKTNPICISIKRLVWLSYWPTAFLASVGGPC